MVKIYPSLISADILNLEREINHLEPHCDGFHLDVMDNHFVPNLTWGPQFINAIAATSAKPVWVHLMVENQHSMIEKLALPIGSTLTIHIEQKNDLAESIRLIRSKKWRVSIAISPKTAIQKSFMFLNKEIDQVLIMSVEPGFSGQAFIPSSAGKIQMLIEYRQKNKLSFSIAMDGGINISNIARLAQQGVEEFGIASGIYGQHDRLHALQVLYKKAQEPAT